ncbi:MAG TPA: hypothetical protein VF821_23245, partial [Lentzea sp.]
MPNAWVRGTGGVLRDVGEAREGLAHVELPSHEPSPGPALGFGAGGIGEPAEDLVTDRRGGDRRARARPD